MAAEALLGREALEDNLPTSQVLRAILAAGTVVAAVEHPPIHFLEGFHLVLLVAAEATSRMAEAREVQEPEEVRRAAQGRVELEVLRRQQFWGITTSLTSQSALATDLSHREI